MSTRVLLTGHDDARELVVTADGEVLHSWSYDEKPGSRANAFALAQSFRSGIAAYRNFEAGKKAAELGSSRRAA
ncbi:hypothetical protein [Acuticoccus kandeliae]|uniref:hypothetical protein n=1 Tax=Acuticoccus kandeliae TaxID=2073160 RepID=UPI000D3E5E29|nr:hypothetical protein [Acuticoccus kandeliae]